MPGVENSIQEFAPEHFASHSLPEKCVARETSPVIERDTILVINKLSALQWDQQARGLTQEELLKDYERQGESGERMLGSHLRQQQVIRDLGEEIDPGQIVSIRNFRPEMLKGAKLVIALGGDDHFKQVTHLIDDATPVMGINSDPLCSEGNLTSASAADLPLVIQRLERGDYRLEPWTRLRLEMNGRDIGPAVGEVVLAKQDFRLMSRHMLELNGERVLQKSSGILISTGAGSTGWYTSAGLYLDPRGRPFPRTAPIARFELREPHIRLQEEDPDARKVLPPLVEGEIKPGETLTLTSLNNSSGIASRDSLDTVPFERGSVAKISIDSKPLWVISFNHLHPGEPVC